LPERELQKFTATCTGALRRPLQPSRKLEFLASCLLLFGLADRIITMKITKFQTDKRLWFWMSLSLFVGCWIFLHFSIKGENETPVRLLWEWLVSFCRGELSLIEASGRCLLLGSFAFWCGLVCTVSGWLVQCAVVVVRTKMREAKTHA
jgi:hypothetical protein